MNEEETQAPKAAKQVKPTRAEFEYDALIKHFPAPGGEGAHQAFFKAGALGYRARLTEEKIVADVKAALPQGRRSVSDDEIETGVSAGFADAMGHSLGGAKEKSQKAAKSRIPADAFKRLAALGKGATEADIMARSPVPLDFPETEAGWRALELLYKPDDWIYMGKREHPGAIGRTVRSVTDWVKALKAGETFAHSLPHIIINPLTGQPAPTKADAARVTMRGDNNVLRFDHMVVEMDHTPLDEQLAFWMAVPKLQVRALINSGNKSIHAWVAVDCADREEWEREIEEKLFPCYLVPLGADPSCRNESRLSRVPGHIRQPGDKNPGALQKLIYLAPEGKAVCE